MLLARLAANALLRGLPVFVLHVDEIIRGSANMPLVPADGVIEAARMRAGRGDMTALKGSPIQAGEADGWRWIASPGRTDGGSGACALIRASRLDRLIP